ncbi:MAG TPA: VOC family protein [Actinospica sp.]|jgi:predicted enzyme related to lactoylglutathione lyase|nr:VOC family protein [Actinospica sp.]
MDFELVFAGMPVSDLGVAVDWYTRLIGRAADVPVNETEVMWQLADSAFVYVVLDPEHAGSSVLSLAVADLDAAVAEAAERGVPGGPIELVGTAGRRATCTDPDGNRVALIQVNQ